MAKLSNLSSGNNNDKKNKKKKKKKTSGPKSLAMKVSAPKDNPFESIWSRSKFDILGKKRKGEERRVGYARSVAIEKRKKTLLKEYKQSGKSSAFIDKRIGEENEELGEFDKAILRSQRQRKLKLTKGSKFNLSDGEEDEYFGSHSLGALPISDDFEDEMMLEDEDDAGAADTRKPAGLFGDMTYHDGGYQQKSGLVEGEENRRKSKKEVMNEVIAKSKFFKAQKAKDKEDNEQFIEELDKKFESLAQSEALLSMSNAGNANTTKVLVEKKNEHLKEDGLPTAFKINFNQEKPDVFDKLVKEMALEMRARPSDRIKTPEETAQEERERLEQLEEERQKRMLGIDNSSDEEYEDANNASVQKPKSISGDDLGDSFLLDNEPLRKKGWVDEILERRNADDESEDDSADLESSEDGDSAEDSESGEDDGDEEFEEGNSIHEVNPSLKDWEQSDDDILDANLEEDDEASDGGKKQDKKEIGCVDSQKAWNKGSAKSNKNDGIFEDAKNLQKDKKRQTEQELPYLIEAPESFEHFSSLLDDCSNNDVILIINRIRASNAIKLAEKNLEKMQRFYGILLQYYAVLANKKPVNVELLNMLVKPLIEMSMETPFYAATCARTRISHTHKQFCLQNKNSETRSWPSFKTLILLKLWSMIYPCSDYHHVVITPSILLMCEYLMRCPIATGRDIAIGSFLCSLLLSVSKQSTKFCPEAIHFIQTLLMGASTRRSLSSQNSQIYHLAELKALGSLLHIQNPVNEICPLNFFVIMELTEDSSFFSSDKFRAGLLLTVIETLDRFVNVYGRLNSFPEIFSPILTVLVELAQQENMPEALQDKFRNVAKLIEVKAEEHLTVREPLKMRKRKAAPIKLLNPKFEENFVKGRDYDPDRERAERKKLQKLVKREAKGAARELRKDNHFLFEVKAKEKMMQEEERAEKYGKAKAFLQEQESAFKSGLLGKGKGKGKKRMR